jgi:nucleoside-diphosphate-sugar epimerase
VKVLVTGADGFVGRHLVRRLLRDGHAVGAAVRRDAPVVAQWRGAAVTLLPFELTDDASIASALQYDPDAVVHLAAVASNRDAG